MFIVILFWVCCGFTCGVAFVVVCLLVGSFEVWLCFLCRVGVGDCLFGGVYLLIYYEFRFVLSLGFAFALWVGGL